MAVTELSKKIKVGDLNAIMEGFLSEAGFYRAQAIISVVNNNLMNDAIKKQLYKLRNDNLRIIGYSISDFATAALDKFDIEKYRGDKPSIISLINSDKWFE